MVPGQSWEDYRVEAGGVSCYSSRDRVHWKNEGVALAADPLDTASDLYSGRVIERPKVVFNERTGKYVMWMHIDRDDYGYARAGVAVASRPEGPYRYLGSCRPNGQMSRDMTVFKDPDDGRAYLVYASENNNTMQVCLLSDDYLRPTTVFKRILVGQRREAPAVFKSGGRYFLITSLCSGWDPNAARYAVADSMLGEWKQEGNPCIGPDSATTFHSQSTFVLPVEAAAGRFLFMADRWNKTNLEGSGYLWLPLRVKDSRVEIRDTSASDRRYAIGGLALVDYNLRARGDGYSFVRFYNGGDSLLLEYREPVKDGGSGNYTETPPGTKYMVVGVREVEAVDSIHVELNVGETGQRREPVCDLGKYMRPFWKGDTVYNETVLVPGRLLYEPDKVLSVRNYALDTVYRAGKDFLVKGREIVRPAGSAMPLPADTAVKGDLAWWNLQSRWVVVTYTHHDRWPGPVPTYVGDQLPHLMGRLRSGLPVRIVAYGMSITRGMDVSGYDRVAPYMPTYMELFARGVQERYPRTAVQLYNAGLPGSTVSWGAQYASDYVCPLHPDLVVLDFGMNDFWRMRPAEFGDSIRSIVRKVRASDPGVEFLLLSNMKFDPAYVLDSDTAKGFYMGNLAGYHEVLRAMEGPGVVGLNMTGISDVLYQRKKAKDCIVNPLHPNDYMARWYAQGMVGLVVN
jgi:hypothetical protein